MTSIILDNAQQHPTFYFPHGDLVIQSAEDADGHSVLFRVNKSVFAFNSPVFADMFDLPSNPEAQDTHDGAPVVPLTETAEELAELIRALYDPACVPQFSALLTDSQRRAPVRFRSPVSTQTIHVSSHQ